jgi:hypothetical protein
MAGFRPAVEFGGGHSWTGRVSCWPSLGSKELIVEQKSVTADAEL